MSSVPLHPIKRGSQQPSSPLPNLIQTPSGLALLELQGNFNLTDDGITATEQEVTVGRIDFPDYHPETQLEGSTSWMKRVYMYVGQHQRLSGEVKKLPKALAIIRKRVGEGTDGHGEMLEVVEIVKYKLVFSQRPEPVGTST
jgi:chromosome transmission fidelity protein 8